MVIDFHAHIFPDKIARRAVEGISAFYGGYEMRGDGGTDMLLRFGDEAGVDRFVVHSVAMTPAHVRSVNEFIASAVRAHPDRFIGFFSLHPDMADMEDAVKRAMDAGLVGVKVHPDMQAFPVDGDKAMSMFETCAKYKLKVLIHAGDDRYAYSNPKQIRAMKDRLPQLTVIAAHYGGYSRWDESREYLADTDVYVDCSSSFFLLTVEQARDLTRAFGSKRVLFGSDYPMWRAKEEMEKLRRLDLTREEMDDILGNNALRLLGL